MSNESDDVEIEIDVERERTEDRSASTDETTERDSDSSDDRMHPRGHDDDSHRPKTTDATHRADPLEGADSPERRLEDELGRIDLLTTPEGYVEGRVTELTAIDETSVRLEVALPHDERVAFTLEKPIPWSEEFLLARIVEDVGYDAASVGHLVGETVYLTRTDVGPEADEDDDWLSASIRATGDAVLASLSPALSDRFGFETDRSPQWRLVDPLERPDPDEDDRFSGTTAIATAAIVLGVIAAVFGAIVGATGELVVSATILAAILPGLVLVLFGLFLFSTARE